MRIDAARYGGRCRCGREHQMATRLCVIEPGALERFDSYLEQAGVSGRCCAVYDTNTYAIDGLRRPAAEQEVVLEAEGLHADETATAKLMAQLRPEIQVLIAVGSGTIHDTVRYCAKELGLPFVSVPTAASCDGFCSTVSAMTWHGYKKTLPGKAPALVVADLDVIGDAPWYLTASGIGDMLGKFVALADWRISHAVTGEEVCPAIYDMTREALDRVWQSCRTIRAGGRDAYASVTYGLLLSGLSMQMMGNSRPASGAEHHISHFIEMSPAALDVHSTALHGEKVGVGTVLASAEYHRLADIQDIAPLTVPYRAVPEERFREIFGERLFAGCREENTPDCLAQVTPEALVRAWPDIREIVADIPPAEEILGVLERLGAKRSLPDLGVPEETLPLLLDDSPLVRGRLTLMRMRRMIRH